MSRRSAHQILDDVKCVERRSEHAVELGCDEDIALAQPGVELPALQALDKRGCAGNAALDIHLGELPAFLDRSTLADSIVIMSLAMPLPETSPPRSSNHRLTPRRWGLQLAIGADAPAERPHTTEILPIAFQMPLGVPNPLADAIALEFGECDPALLLVEADALVRLALGRDPHISENSHVAPVTIPNIVTASEAFVNAH